MANSIAIDFDTDFSSHNNISFGTPARHGPYTVQHMRISSLDSYAEITPMPNGTNGIKTRSETYYVGGSFDFAHTFSIDAYSDVESTRGNPGEVSRYVYLSVELFSKKEGEFVQKVGRVTSKQKIGDSMSRVSYTAPPGHLFFMGDSQFSFGYSFQNSPCNDCGASVYFYLDNVGFDFFEFNPKEIAIETVEPNSNGELKLKGVVHADEASSELNFDVGLFRLNDQDEIDWAAPIALQEWQTHQLTPGNFESTIRPPQDWQLGYAVAVDAGRNINERSEFNNVYIVEPLTLEQVRVEDDLPYAERVDSDVIWETTSPTEFKAVVDAYDSQTSRDGIQINLDFNDAIRFAKVSAIEASWRIVLQQTGESVIGWSDELLFADADGEYRMPIETPRRVGAYRLDYRLFAADSHTELPFAAHDHELLVVAQNPILPLFQAPNTATADSHPAPLWELKKATEFGRIPTLSQPESPVTLLDRVMRSVYKQGWAYELRYGEHRPPKNLYPHTSHLLQGATNIADCRNYATAFVHLSRLLGFRTDLHSVQGLYDPSYFLSVEGLVAPNGATGNAAMTGGKPDRWFFASHTFGRYTDLTTKETKFFDPTFGRQYAHDREFIAANTKRPELNGLTPTDDPRIDVAISSRIRPTSAYPLGFVLYFEDISLALLPPTRVDIGEVRQSLSDHQAETATGLNLAIEFTGDAGADYLVSASLLNDNGDSIVSQSRDGIPLLSSDSIQAGDNGVGIAHVRLSGSQIQSADSISAIRVQVFNESGQLAGQSEQPFSVPSDVMFDDSGLVLVVETEEIVDPDIPLDVRLDIQADVYGPLAEGDQFVLQLRDKDNAVLATQEMADSDSATRFERPWRRVPIEDAGITIALVSANGESRYTRQFDIALPASWLNSPHHNSVNPVDVTIDGLSIRDAFVIIDAARNEGYGGLESRNLREFGWVDVNNDDRFRSDDVLQVLSAVRQLVGAPVQASQEWDNAVESDALPVEEVEHLFREPDGLTDNLIRPLAYSAQRDDQASEQIAVFDF